MFKKDDYVVYKKNVCRIKAIREKLFNGKDCYALIPVDDSSLIINVPVTNTNDELKPIISIEEINVIIKNIPSIEVIPNSNDRYIENEYKKLLATGNHEDLIKIIKTSYLRNKNRKEAGKKLSERDDNYFNMAENLLYNEFSIALNMSFEDTKKYIINKVVDLKV